MRFVGFVACVFAVATGGCATRPAPPVNAPPMAARPTAGQTVPAISGVWDAMPEGYTLNTVRAVLAYLHY